MNVLLSSFVHWWNAEAAYAAALAEALLEAGHGAWVMTRPGTRNAVELARRGLPTITSIPLASRNPVAWPGALSRLVALQRRERIDVVDVFRSAEFSFHLWAARGAGGPAVVRTRGTARPVGSGRLNRKMHGGWCDGLIASSDLVNHQLRERLGLAPGRAKTIYYPAEAPPPQGKTNHASGREQWLDRMGVPAHSLVLGIVGRLYPEKGHAVLLRAMASLVKEHPRTLLLILAKDAPGEDPERPRLEKLVRELGLGAHVKFLGFTENVREVMGWMDIGVIPSLASEVNCRVAVEFFSAGTPVVAFPTGALPEVVQDGQTGLVTPTHQPEPLAAALNRLAGDKALRKGLGEGAKESATGRFSRATFLEQTLAVFEQARERKGARYNP